MKQGKILIIDDNKAVLTALEFLLQPIFKDVVTASSPNNIPTIIEKNNFDVVLLDMNYSSGINSGNEGLYWLKRILEIEPDMSVVMITAYGDVELAVKSLKEGAVDFVLKPWENSKIIATINTALKLRKSIREVQHLKLKEEGLKSEINKKNYNIIGESKELRKTLDIVNKVAKTDANILITGENGTGKDLIAKEIYLKSNRNKEIFVSVDMGSITETLFESELFGHIKGAFTDAKEDRIGKFEIAKGGTLFLDEIGNIPLPLQAKLLTVLETRQIVRVGSNKKIDIDIRLICATNSDLIKMVEEGQFREDLLYRINTIQIEIPPLRERVDDIIPLANFFLEKYSGKYDKRGIKISKSALSKLEEYTWNGNVRELQHAIEKAVIMCDGDTIKPNDFLFHNSKKTRGEEVFQTLEEMEKNMISRYLEKYDNNLSTVSAKLGITRQTLYNKIKKYNI